MYSPTRRGHLRQIGAIAATGLAGCLSRTDGSPDLRTETPPRSADGSCSATDPPKPPEAAVQPRNYPPKPRQLATGPVASFARAYERTYRYNRQLAAHPTKLGRTNDLDVSIRDTTVETDDGRFTIVVSGQRHFDVREPSGTPSTPTQTPLPTGHRPFETTYVVTDRFVRREGVTVECW